MVCKGGWEEAQVRRRKAAEDFKAMLQEHAQGPRGEISATLYLTLLYCTVTHLHSDTVTQLKRQGLRGEKSARHPCRVALPHTWTQYLEGNVTFSLFFFFFFSTGVLSSTVQSDWTTQTLWANAHTALCCLLITLPLPCSCFQMLWPDAREVLESNSQKRFNVPGLREHQQVQMFNDHRGNLYR